MNAGREATWSQPGSLVFNSCLKLEDCIAIYVQSLKKYFLYIKDAYKMQHSLDSFHTIYLDFVSEIKNVL